MRTAIIFDNFGPYHRARLLASAHAHELTAVQIFGQSAVYAWENENRETGFRLITLFSDRTNSHVQAKEIVRKIDETLDRCRPEVVAIPGWSSCAALA